MHSHLEENQFLIVLNHLVPETMTQQGSSRWEIHQHWSSNLLIASLIMSYQVRAHTTQSLKNREKYLGAQSMLQDIKKNQMWHQALDPTLHFRNALIPSQMSTKYRAFPKRLGSKIMRRTNPLIKEDTTLQIKSTLWTKVQCVPLVKAKKDIKDKKLLLVIQVLENITLTLSIPLIRVVMAVSNSQSSSDLQTTPFCIKMVSTIDKSALFQGNLKINKDQKLLSGARSISIIKIFNIEVVISWLRGFGVLGY